MAETFGISQSNYWRWGGINTDNVVGDFYLMPDDGWLVGANVHAGGYGETTYAQICAWDEFRNLIHASAQQTWIDGRDWHGASLPALRVRRGQNRAIGFWRHPQFACAWSTLDNGATHHVQTWLNEIAPPASFQPYVDYGTDLTLTYDFVRNVAPLKGAWRTPSPTGTTPDVNPIFSGSLPHPGPSVAAVPSANIAVEEDPGGEIVARVRQRISYAFAHVDDELTRAGVDRIFERDVNRVAVARATARVQAVGGDDAYDYSAQVQIWIRRTSDNVTVYNQVFEPTTQENSQNYFSRRMGISLTPGTSYYAIYRHQDSFGLWSPWSASIAFAVSAGPDKPTSLSPTGKINTYSGYSYNAVYSHPSGVSANAKQVQVFSGDGGSLLYDSGVVAASAAPGGTLSVVEWHPNLVAGRAYQWRIRARDTNNIWGPWSDRVRLSANAPPHVPSKLLPSGGQVTPSGLLRCSVYDPDGDTIVGATAKVFTLAGAVVYNAAQWAASTAYAVGNERRPTTANGHRYKVTVAGNSAATQPVWPTAAGATVVDGGVTWQEAGSDTEFGMVIATDGKTASIDITSRLVLSTTYKWQAIAYDGILWGSWSGFAQFTYAQVPEVNILSPRFGGLTNLVQQPSAEYDPAVVGTWWTEINRATGKNLLTRNQSNIETDLTGIGTYGATVTRDTIEFYEGATSLKVVTTGSVKGVTTNPVQTRIITANTNVVSSAYVKFPLNIYGYIYTRAYNSAGTFLGQVNGTFTGTGAWQRVEAPAFTRAEGFTVDILVVSADVAAQTFYVDAMQVEEAAIASTWEPGGVSRIDRSQDGDAPFGISSWEAITDGDPYHRFESALIPVDATKHYFFAAELKTMLGSPATHLRLRCYDANGAFLADIYPSSLAASPTGTTPAATWTRYGGEVWYSSATATHKFPAATTQVRVQWYPSAISGTSGTVRMDAVFLVQADTATGPNWLAVQPFYGYFDGDRTGFGAGDAYLWSGAAGNSASSGYSVLEEPAASIEISYSSSAGAAKIADRIQIWRWNGVEFLKVYENGYASQGSRILIPLPTNVIKNEGRYWIQVWVKDANQLEGASRQAEFDVQYDGPPEVAIQQVADSSADASLTVDHPPSSLQPAEFVRFEYEISQPDGTMPIFVSMTPETSRFVYHFPVSGYMHRVRVRQVQMVGGEEVEGKWIASQGVVEFAHRFFLKSVSEPDRLAVSFYAMSSAKPAYTARRSVKEYQTWDSEKPKHARGKLRADSGSLEIWLFDAEEFVKSADERRRILDEMIDAGVICLLSHKPADKRFVQITDNIERTLNDAEDYVFSINYAQTAWNEDYFIREGLYELGQVSQ